jgi:hypothetical protein
MTIGPPRRVAQGLSALTQLLLNVQIHDRASARGRNSRSLCRYKITSHLHIPHLLKVPHFQYALPASHLTYAVCADPQMQGEGSNTLRALFRPGLDGAE